LRVVHAALVRCRLLEDAMPITLLTVQPLVALLFGILILVMPRLLNMLVAIYLILIGAMGLWPQLFKGVAEIYFGFG
jgi:hypothetical protein